jgi:4-amino-4-deoxy-L-arabinose transferase-like glycosyltransferase
MGDRVEALPGIYDQISYDALAVNLLAGRGYQFDQPWYPFTPAGTPTAHWSFAYPAYLAAVYALFGHHPLAARLIQAAVGGALLMYLTYLLAKRFFGPKTGVVAAAAAGFYGYFIYHNAALMTETFYIVTVLATLELAYRIVEEERRWAWLLLGVSMGSAVLLRQVFLAFVPLLLLWILWRKRSRETALQMAGSLGIVALFVLPWTWRNYQVFDRFLLLNSNSGYALYTSNNPHHGTHWDPWFTAPIPEQLQGANEAQMDAELTSLGLGFIRDDPIRFLTLSLGRISYHFRFWPTTDSQLISNLVRSLSFGVYLPFMVAGLWLSRAQWRRFLPLYVFGLVFVALHVFTWPGPRYRFPVDAILMIFAALAVVRLARAVLRKSSITPADLIGHQEATR